MPLLYKVPLITAYELDHLFPKIAYDVLEVRTPCSIYTMMGDIHED